MSVSVLDLEIVILHQIIGKLRDAAIKELSESASEKSLTADEIAQILGKAIDAIVNRRRP